MTQVLYKRFPISAWVGTILFGIACVLISAATLLVVMMTHQDGISFYDSEGFGVLLFGLIFIIPFGAVCASSIRLLRRGANKVTGVTYLVLALILALITVFIFTVGIEVIADADADTSNPAERVGYIIGASLPVILLAVITLWLAITSFRILRAKSHIPTPIGAFD